MGWELINGEPPHACPLYIPGADVQYKDIRAGSIWICDLCGKRYEYNGTGFDIMEEDRAANHPPSRRPIRQNPHGATPEILRLRGRKAALTRSRESDDPELVATDRELATAQIEAFVEGVLKTAPPLTEKQLAKITRLLNAAPRYRGGA